MSRGPSAFPASSSPGLPSMPNGATSVIDTERFFTWLDLEVKARLTAIDWKLDRILTGQSLPHSQSLHATTEPIQDSDLRWSKFGMQDRDKFRPARQGSGDSSVSPQASTAQVLACKSDIPGSIDTTFFKNAMMDKSSTNLEIDHYGDEKAAVQKFVYEKNQSKIGCDPRRVEALKRRRYYRDMIFAFLDNPESGSFALIYAELLSLFTAITVFITTIQTVDPPVLDGVVAAVLETMFDSVFLIDLGLRFICCPQPHVFFANGFNVLDMIVSGMLVLRAYAGFNLVSAPDWVRVILLCFAPTLRFMKTLRRFQKILLIFTAFQSAFEALPMLIWFLLTILLVSSTTIYLAERPTNIDSLPRSMWFVIVTLSTVGYGDISPSTPAGHLMTALLIIFSALYMAMPIGIMGGAFQAVWKDRDRILLISQTRRRFQTWGYTADDIPIIFGIFDTDNSGFIELSEFVVMIHEMRIGLSKERIVTLFETIDADGGGTIDDREFVRHVFPEEFLQLYEMTPISPGLMDGDSGNQGDSAKKSLVRALTMTAGAKPTLHRKATVNQLYKRRAMGQSQPSEAAVDYITRIASHISVHSSLHAKSTQSSVMNTETEAFVYKSSGSNKSHVKQKDSSNRPGKQLERLSECMVLPGSTDSS